MVTDSVMRSKTFGPDRIKMQSDAWKSLPEDTKEEIKRLISICNNNANGYFHIKNSEYFYNIGKVHVLEYLFGSGNVRGKEQ